ncbi:YutD-like domain-containing protein [Paenibacillus chitinolyticus]|uniref:YutD family protein n=1 Tax=Paenibacillus chitinolyticus TaxID=79263 RepID=UPI0036D9B433
MIHIGGRAYELVTEHRNGWNQEVFRDRYSEVLERYDYIVGDWGYSQLRLRGFFRENHSKAGKESSIVYLQDYLNEYCNFGCAYFILEKLPGKHTPPEQTEEEAAAAEGTPKPSRHQGQGQGASRAEAKQESREGKSETREPRADHKQEARESRQEQRGASNRSQRQQDGGRGDAQVSQKQGKPRPPRQPRGDQQRGERSTDGKPHNQRQGGGQGQNNNQNNNRPKPSQTAETPAPPTGPESPE